LSESSAAATDLDLISFLRVIPETRTRRGIRIPVWDLLLVVILAILSSCQRLLDLGRYSWVAGRVSAFRKATG
jgi:hypothetical protein